VPAIVATRHRPASLVATGGRVVAGGAHRWRRGLVAAQVALSLLLSVSAALLLRSYYNLTHVNPGFTTEGAVTFHVAARWDEDRTRVGQLQAALLDAFGRMPGVEAAGFVNFLPATGGTLRFAVRVEGLAGTEANGTMQVGERTISPGYLRALGVPLRGSLLLLVAVSLLGALAFSGLGLLTAARPRTIEGVSGVMNLVMVPMWIFSGIFFSTERFPAAMQPFIQALPLTALNNALRGVMLEGAGLSSMLPQLALLAAWGAISFLVALKIFRWQ